MNASQQLAQLRSEVEAQGFEQFRVEYMNNRRGLPDRIFYRSADRERHATITRTKTGGFAVGMDI